MNLKHHGNFDPRERWIVVNEKGEVLGRRRLKINAQKLHRDLSKLIIEKLEMRYEDED